MVRVSSGYLNELCSFELPCLSELNFYWTSDNPVEKWGVRDFEKGKFYKKGKKGDFLLKLSF